MPLTLNTTGVTIVDDTDPRITWQGFWFTGGVSSEYRSTTHGSDTAGATATFVFQGEQPLGMVYANCWNDIPIGTSVAVYGTIGTEGSPSSTFNLDDSSLVTRSAAQVNSAARHALFYQSPTLLGGSHRVVITNLQNTGTLWIDYILFIPDGSSPAPQPPVVSTSEVSITTTSVSRSGRSSSSRSSSRSSSSTSLPARVTNSLRSGSVIATSTGTDVAQHASTSAVTGSSASIGTRSTIAAAVGGVIGGLLLLLLLAAVMYYRRLALKHQKSESEPTVFRTRLVDHPTNLFLFQKT